MALRKPTGVKNDAFLSAKWDEITGDREFRESDASNLELLCMWYKIVSQAQDELADFNNQTAYPSENGDLKPLPQIGTLKTASGEIRALNKALGLCSDEQEVKQSKKKVTELEIIQNKRRKKANVKVISKSA